MLLITGDPGVEMMVRITDCSASVIKLLDIDDGENFN